MKIALDALGGDYGAKPNVLGALKAAKELKLVDELGGLDTAITLAAGLSGTTEYNIASYPEKEDFLTSLMNTGTDRYINSRIKSTFGELYNGMQLLRHVDEADRLQARMPFELRIR